MNFELNFQDLFEIDTTPEGASRTWKRLGKGISSFVPATNDNVDQTAYLDGNGFGSSDVIGKQLTYAATGHRVIGDLAQDYIAAKKLALGDDLKTNFRAYDSAGNMVMGPCTLTNIVVGGGDANGKKSFTFEVHINGEPSDTTGAAAGALTSVVAPGSAAGTTKFTATAGAGNSLAYKLTSAALAPNADSYPGDLVSYTSAANINAAVGQYLNMFELNAYGRVVLFATALLDSGDFPV